MTLEHTLLAVHAVATLFMVGLIWVIQLVHYPLFARVGHAEFALYEREHMRRIGWIVGPVMLVELATSIGLVVRMIPGVDARLAWTGLVLVALIWASTAAVQAPTHARLANGKDERLIRRLVLSNWLRTVLWSLRGGIAMAMLVQGMRA